MSADIDEFTQRFLDALRGDGIDTTCQVCGGGEWHEHEVDDEHDAS
jgi:hypothetical protein